MAERAAEASQEWDGEARAIVPKQERSVDFYGDQVLAALVQEEGEERVYVPLRPICEYLGLDPASQARRVRRDAVMGKSLKGVVILTAPSAARGGGPQTMTCLPLKYLPGWLFGITPGKVRPELRDKVIRYQEECFEVLWRAFQVEATARQGTAELAARRDREPAANTLLDIQPSGLLQIRGLALAIAQLAEQQMGLESRLDSQDSRLDRAAEIVASLQRRLSTVESHVLPSALITDEQAAEISSHVKALAQTLTHNDPSRNHYQSVFAELYRRFGVSSYKNIRREQFQEVLDFLEQWRRAATEPGADN